MTSKKIAAFVLAGSMVAAALAGCGNTSKSKETAKPESGTEITAGTEAAAADTSEHVVLTMYCIGDEGGIYAQQHLDKLNEVLTEKINAEINPVMVSWGDYKTKLPMVWASGEAYDLTYVANWTGYFAEADKGAFMDITELFPAYAPKTYAECQEKGYLETTKVNDRLYMVPADKPEYTTFFYNYREDLRKKYNCPEIVDLETLETYMQAIKDNEPGMTAYGYTSTETMRFACFLNEQDWSRPLDAGITGIFVYDLKDPTKVFNVTETPEYEEFIKKTREYYEKGYWSQSIMAETAATRDLFKSGQTAIYLSNHSNGNLAYQEMLSQHPEWEIGVYSSDLESRMTERVAAANNGMAVGAYSKNPERAMMFLELAYQDQEVYDLVVNGLEGVTYEKDEAAMTKWIPEGMDASELGVKNLGMGINTQKFYLSSKNDNPLVTKLTEEYDKVAVFPDLAGFSINQDEISAELAAIKSVAEEYKFTLDKGVVEPEEGLARLRQKLKDAGSEKLLEEINAQIADYLAK
ncbi:ABC transporter substrate-binding protein [Hungatella hathewayi]|uniref:ABC transporter substrate-binding protein n=1 Tax=Hungatella hathewayi TaxID=154046 RepID=UPI0035615ED6